MYVCVCVHPTHPETRHSNMEEAQQLFVNTVKLFLLQLLQIKKTLHGVLVIIFTRFQDGALCRYRTHLSAGFNLTFLFYSEGEKQEVDAVIVKKNRNNPPGGAALFFFYRVGKSFFQLWSAR